MNSIPVNPKRRITGAFSWMLFERFADLFSALAVAVAMARFLGPSDIGKYTYVLAIAALIQPIVSLGLSNILTKDMMDQTFAEAKILGTAAVMSVVSAFVATGLVYLYVKLGEQKYPDISVFVLLVTFAKTISAFDFLQTWFLVKSKIKVYSVARIITIVIFLFIKLFMLFNGSDLYSFLYLAAIEAAVIGLRCIIAYVLQRELVVRWEFSAVLALSLLSRAWPIIIGGLSAAAYLKVDIIMLAELGAASEAGIYTAAARLSEVWYIFPFLFMNAVFPDLLNMRRVNPYVYQLSIEVLLTAMAVFGSIVAVTVTLLSGMAIRILYGAEFIDASAVLAIHIWASIFMSMRTVLVKWITAEEKFRLSASTQTMGLVVNVLLNLWLIPDFGAVGAAIATLISYAVASYLSLLFFRTSREMFWKMTRALLWPFYISRDIKSAARVFAELQIQRRDGTSASSTRDST